MKLNLFNARTFLPPEGILASAEVLIVGDCPSYNDVRARRQFSGATEAVLRTALTAANLNRSTCYLTTVIKDLDKSPALRFDFKKKTFSEDAQQYIALLKEELSLSSARFIIAFGEIALGALTSRQGIYQWRGSVVESTLLPGRWVIPMLHPQTVVPPLCQTLNQPLLNHDCEKLSRWLKLGAYQPPRYECRIAPSYLEAINFLLELYNCASLTAFDIEVFNEEVSCISFCNRSDYVMSIPFCSNDGDYFTPEQELSIWDMLAKILGDASIPKLGQNLTFDAHFLLRKYGIVVRNIHDTMVAQQVLSPDFKKGLDFITSVHTDFPYHKDEGKRWFKVGGAWEQLWNYNGLDSLVCFVAFPKQLAALEEQGNLATYERQRAIIPALVYMQEHGLKADLAGITAAKATILSQIALLEAELNLLAGHPLNANSPKQLTEYFYTEKKFPAYRTKGKTSTDDIAMKRLIRKGSKEAKIVLEIRKLRKISSTYLDETKFDGDKRLRCSYNPVGTRYSRISSKENIFETGMNMQNWPHELQKFLGTDDDCVGYAFDLSQAENRIVAYVGAIPEMIEAFENGTDVHSLTASMIFNQPPSEIKNEDKLGITCPLGDSTHTKRDWGKKCNHSSNYDIGADSISLKFEMPKKDAEFLLERYHSAYPGVRKTFHKLVQNQLHSSRTVTNLMGRKTLFLGPLDSNTYKEAYSGIPQGTVGDVINERGLSYVYNNQAEFAEVELLNQIHDEIQFQVPITAGWLKHARILKLVKASLETPLKTFDNRSFVIPADLMLFKRCKVGKKLSSKQLDLPETELAKLLEATWYQVEKD